jgi:glutaredoxin 3
MIIVYSKKVCPNCVQVKQFLESKGIKYTEVDIETNAAGRDVLVEHGLRSVPQVFHGEQLIGDLQKTKTWLELKEQTL